MANKRVRDAYTELYSPLVGMTVKAIAADKESGFYGLIFRDGTKKETIAWIQCDEEGNGPGFLQIE